MYTPPARMSWVDLLRVAFVTVGDTSRRTGGYLYNARVITGLRALGVEVIVAGGASPKEQRESASRLGFLVNPASFDVVVVDALARIAAAPHLDRWRASVPVVAMVHELQSVAGEEIGAEHIAREREYEEPLLRADRLVAVSDHGKNLLEMRGIPSGRISVVPPGFDRFARVAEPSGADGPVRVLCVAQWIPRKGILTLVEAWAQIERPGAILQLIGETDADPDYTSRVRAAITAAPEGSITVNGVVDDAALENAYAGADLFALPSWYEGYGIVYAEALAHGLPVIACRVGPVPELVGRDAALLVPPDDADALSNALDQLIGDPTRRARMSEAARRRAAHLPRWEDAVTGFNETLQAAISGRAPRSDKASM